MNLTFINFVTEAIHNPTLFVIIILILGVVLVNGWTDAPNAIATCVSTRSMSPKKAIMMAAIFNFAGVFIMTLISSTVAETIYNMVDFGSDTHQALIALCAGLVAIVTWAVLAWFFGIPTSESHALIAGVSGAAIALQHGLSGINFSEWSKVLYGLVLSALLGFILGYIFTKIIEFIFKKFDRRKTIPASAFTIPVWLLIVISLTMTLGTSIGGYKIIKTVGMKMVKMEPYQGTAADLASATCLLLSSLTGMPVSTTHTKTTAIMGVGASKKLSNVNWNVVKEMSLAWILTFPGCGLLGYLATFVFIKLFA